MYEKIYEKPDIYNIYIPLPNNPLKNLNCYVIKTPERNLIIDTGFNLPECLIALKEGLDELNIDMNKTDMFITHLHSDHCGLVGEIMKKDSKIYMSKIDYDYLTGMAKGFWQNRDKIFIEEGFPEIEIIKSREINPAKVYAPSKFFKAFTFDDNFKFNIGTYEFKCIITPGHTPGHACLYIEKEKIMFLGDHILFDITPNITQWHNIKNSLAAYLESLKKIKSYEIKTALPSHRKNNINVYERIDQLFNHHDLRLKDTIEIIEKYPRLNAYEIAANMKWSMRGKHWGEFPIQQKWFAVGETLSHLDYLIEENRIYKEMINGIFRYSLLN